jgi:cytochrome c2
MHYAANDVDFTRDVVQVRDAQGEEGMLKVCAVLAVLGLIALVVSVAPRPRSAAIGDRRAVPVSASEVADGKALFVAKGCATCHQHAAVPGSGQMMVGPALSTYRPDPAFLRPWLRDPSAVRPGTRMPQLALSEREIDVLIAFLQAGTGANR